MDFSRFCYELYKKDWLQRIPVETALQSLRDWYATEREIPYSEYLHEEGYDGMFYVCYEEFLAGEFQDAEYMHGLLKDSSLIEIYEEEFAREDDYEAGIS